MTATRRPAPLLLLLIGLAVLCLVVVLTVQAQGQEVTPTVGATGSNPPAQPTNLQATAEHDAVALTWTASTEQTVTHYAVLRRNRDTDASQVFHVIESNAGAETSYTDGSVAASSTYIYRVKSVSPTGVSQWSGYVKAETPAAPDPTPIPTLTPTPEPEPESLPADQAPTNLTAALAEGGGVTLSWTAPAEDADSVTGYEILRAVGWGELATLAADTASTGTAYTDATATQAGETYAYQVKAIRGEERSQVSGQAQVQVPHDPADPEAHRPDGQPGREQGDPELDRPQGERRIRGRLRDSAPPPHGGRERPGDPGGRHRIDGHDLHRRHGQRGRGWCTSTGSRRCEATR